MSNENLEVPDQAPRRLGRELEMEFSNRIVRLFKECYGKGPTQARTTFGRDYALCILEGGFTTAEQTLEAYEGSSAVVAHRTILHHAVRARFSEVAETLLDRKVRSFMSSSDPRADIQAELFILEEPVDDIATS